MVGACTAGSTTGGATQDSGGTLARYQLRAGFRDLVASRHADRTYAEGMALSLKPGPRPGHRNSPHSLSLPGPSCGCLSCASSHRVSRPRSGAANLATSAWTPTTSCASTSSRTTSPSATASRLSCSADRTATSGRPSSISWLSSAPGAGAVRPARSAPRSPGRTPATVPGAGRGPCRRTLRSESPGSQWRSPGLRSARPAGHAARG